MTSAAPSSSTLYLARVHVEGDTAHVRGKVESEVRIVDYHQG